MSIRDDFRFRPSGKRPAVYFNDGAGQSWTQHDDKSGHDPDPNLIKAIRAAKKTFYAVLDGKRP